MKFTQRIAAAALGATAGLAVQFNGVSKLTFVQAKVVTSVTVGARQLELRIEDSAGNVLASMAVGATQAASLTRAHSFIDGVTQRESTVLANQLVAPLPEVIIPANGKLRLLDTADIDHAADTVAITYTVMDSPT